MSVCLKERYTIAEPEEEELSSVVYGTNVNDQSNEVVVFFWTPAPETFLKKKRTATNLYQSVRSKCNSDTRLSTKFSINTLRS